MQLMHIHHQEQPNSMVRLQVQPLKWALEVGFNGQATSCQFPTEGMLI